MGQLPTGGKEAMIKEPMLQLWLLPTMTTSSMPPCGPASMASPVQNIALIFSDISRYKMREREKENQKPALQELAIPGTSSNWRPYIPLALRDL